MNEEIIQIILEDVIEFQKSIATDLGTTPGIRSMALLITMHLLMAIRELAFMPWNYSSLSMIST